MSDWINTVVQMARQYRQHGQSDLAKSMLQNVLTSEPEHALVNIEFGSLQIEQGNFESGLRYLKRAGESALESGDAHFRLGGLYRKSLLHEDSVREYRKAVRCEPENYAYKDALVFSLAYCPNTDLIEDYEVFRATGAFIESSTPRLFSEYKNNGGKIRIGYLGSTLHAHSVSFFLLPILENHSDQFDIYCYHRGEKEDEITQRIKENCTVYRHLHLETLENAAGIIYEDMIDVLVDLDGYTNQGTLRILAHKPAPLQVAWIGYPDTSGMTRMDYRIVDEFTDPDTEIINGIHSEKLIRMPRCFSIYSPPEGMPDVNEAPAKRNGYVTFGSFNKPLKINDYVIEVWARVLAEIPHSTLVLKHWAYAQSVSRWRIITMFKKHGISENRVKFRFGDKLTETHFGRYHDIDIALDTFPYNGTTTTCESLWMGVPVITLAGDKHISRVGLSLLNSVECAEFVAMDRDEYVKIAKNWSANIEMLNGLRQVLRRRMIDSPLMNAKEFVGDLERRLRDIWLNHQ